MYGVCDKTFAKWLRLAEIQTGRNILLTPIQVKELLKKVGPPETATSPEQ